jgi:hypothetical protein
MAKFVSSTRHNAALIVNADDWGRDCNNTDRTLECFLCGAISSVSAMVFMEDSERAAGIARERGVDAGLHLNLTTPFSAPSAPVRLKEHQGKVLRYLRLSRFSPAIFHPGLRSSFEYVVMAQQEEFSRLYGGEPNRMDGHHHMHLCANVLLAGLLPRGTPVRRNFSFSPGEKSVLNRLYRRTVDWMLVRNHPLADFFFPLSPLYPRDRVQGIFNLARKSTVEIETHPFNREEYRFLSGGEIFKFTGGVPISRRYTRIAVSE